MKQLAEYAIVFIILGFVLLFLLKIALFGMLLLLVGILIIKFVNRK